MAESSKVPQYFLILLFSLGIVAIGADELHKRFSKRYLPDIGKAKTLVQDLHDSKDGAVQGKAGVARSNNRQEQEIVVSTSKEQSDNLDRSDRKELNQLLDKIAP